LRKEDRERIRRGKVVRKANLTEELKVTTRKIGKVFGRLKKKGWWCKTKKDKEAQTPKHLACNFLVTNVKVSSGSEKQPDHNRDEKGVRNSLLQTTGKFSARTFEKKGQGMT